MICPPSAHSLHIQHNSVPQQAVHLAKQDLTVQGYPHSAHPAHGYPSAVFVSGQARSEYSKELSKPHRPSLSSTPPTAPKVFLWHFIGIH